MVLEITVLSAGFSIFVHWKVAVNRVHNLRPCTGFLFPVYSCIYQGLYTVLYFTYKWTEHFRWRFFCTVKTLDTTSFSLFQKCVIWPYGQSVAFPCCRPEFECYCTCCVLKNFVLPDFSGRWTGKFRQLLEINSTGIFRSIYCKNGLEKNRSFFVHCYPTVYLPELSSKLKKQ